MPGRFDAIGSRRKMLGIAFVAGFSSALDSRGTLAAEGEFNSRFAGLLAPDSDAVAAPQKELLQVFVNGVDEGMHTASVGNGTLLLPPETLKAIRLPPDTPSLERAADVKYALDAPNSILKLTVPVRLLGAQSFGEAIADAPIAISPETWGGWVDYNVNVRRPIGSGQTSGLQGSGGTTTGFAWGGQAEANVVAPDFIGGTGWAYDSVEGYGPVRLDTNLTWRPSGSPLNVVMGDSVSTVSTIIADARPYRFLGIEAGTDNVTGNGFNNSSIASISGTAQAESSVDVFVNGQRYSQGRTSGGPFTVTLPPGAAGQSTNVVVTDVTGRSQVLELQAPLVDANLLPRKSLLWSGGLGVPRFDYGSRNSSYGSDPYGFLNGRYGWSDRVTLGGHVEGGESLGEAEILASSIPMRRMAVKASVAGSASKRGAGTSGGLGIQFTGPWGLSLDMTATGTLGAFDDVVSASGRSYDERHRIPIDLSLPPLHEVSARVSWQATRGLQLAASFQQYAYPGASPVAFESVSANWNQGRIPLFLDVSRSGSGRHSIVQAVVGASFSFGDAQATITGGVGDDGFAGGIDVSQPLHQSIGDVGWHVNAQRSNGFNDLDAGAELRTGYGIPGVSVQNYGTGTTAYGTMRGTVGVVDMHPFVGDPSSSGVVVVDGGAPGLPVMMNGESKGRTSFDGKLAVPVDVAYAPQRFELDIARMPINVVPTSTNGNVTLRPGGAAVIAFAARKATASAIVTVTVHGKPPPVGATLVGVGSQAPIDSHGRAYLDDIRPNEVLQVEFADGRGCTVRSGFDGKGGIGRRLGPLDCVEGTP